MTGPSTPLALTVHLAWVSSISFGGFPTVLPDVRNFVVDRNRWMTNQEFGASGEADAILPVKDRPR
jgi:chromate transport protein ChrA